MPTTIPSITSSTRPGSPSAGDAYFETDTKNYIIYDGAAWRGFVNDGETLGANGYSLDLDGTDDRVELGTITALNSASAFSITCWVKVSSSAGTTKIFETSGGIYGGISIYQSTNFDFLLASGSSDYRAERYTGDLVRDDTWHHLAFTFGSSTAKIYEGGNLLTTATQNGSMVSATTATSGTTPHIGSSKSDSLNLLGKMDDFAVFNAELTATEVSNIFNGRLYNQSKLIHLYKFENNYNDSKGSLNGTPQGDPTFDSSDKPY